MIRSLFSFRSILILLIAVPACLGSLAAQEELTPATEAGEDFDLYGAISLFEQSEDLADFEKKINDEANDVNNLDLNKDDEVDLLKVVEYEEETTHLIVIQAMISENDVQDIATIEIEKHQEDEVSLQVIGDVDLYGENYIVEPASEDAGKAVSTTFMGVFVSVHVWRPVRAIYRPGRRVFVSAVVWRPRPAWYRPWRPVARATWRNNARRWHNKRWRHATARHSRRANNMYKSKRRTSTVARNNAGPKTTTHNKSSGHNKSKAQTSPNQQKAKTQTSPQAKQQGAQQNKAKTTKKKNAPPKKKNGI